MGLNNTFQQVDGNIGLKDTRKAMSKFHENTGVNDSKQTCIKEGMVLRLKEHNVTHINKGKITQA